MKVKTYDGRPLSGRWDVSVKIDGIQCRRVEDGWVSKSGKKSLYGLDHLLDITKPGEIYEYYAGSWEKSSAIRRKDHVCYIGDIYQIWPKTDVRLKFAAFSSLSSEKIKNLLDESVSYGNEGIMLRQGDTIYKVKQTRTYDVLVTGIYEGKGKHAGRMGGVETDMGRVGGGWNDAERVMYFLYPEEIVGRTIEVKCMELTKNNKFRHGNKVRIRWDKE